MRLAMLETAVPVAGGAVHYPAAVVSVHLGDTDAAITHLQRMVDERLSCAVFIAVDPSLRLLRGDPRYDALVKRVGVPLPQTASAPHTAST